MRDRVHRRPVPSESGLSHEDPRWASPTDAAAGSVLVSRLLAGTDGKNPDLQPSELAVFEDAEEVRVGLGDVLPSGQTRQKQLDDGREADQEASLYVLTLLFQGGAEVAAQIEQFRAAASDLGADSDVPGIWAIRFVRDRLVEFLRVEVPFLASPVFGTAWEIVQNFLPAEPSMDVPRAAQQLAAETARMWASAGRARVEALRAARGDVRAAYASAPAGKQREAVVSALSMKGFRRGDFSGLALALTNRLEEAIHQFKCQHETLYAAARGQACAMTGAPRKAQTFE